MPSRSQILGLGYFKRERKRKRERSKASREDVDMRARERWIEARAVTGGGQGGSLPPLTVSGGGSAPP